MKNYKIIDLPNKNHLVYTYINRKTYYEILDVVEVKKDNSPPDTMCKNYGCTSNKGKPFVFSFGYNSIVNTIFCTDCENQFLKENLN